MARFEKKFVKAIYKNTGGFFATWPLGRQVKLGDVIDIKRKRMDYLGNIADPAIGIQIIPGPDITADKTKWQSKSNVNIVIKAKGESPKEGSNLPIDKAGVTITFTKQGGFIFQPTGVKYNRIENLVTVRQEAIKKLTSDLFNLRKVYLIKEVAVVDSYSLTISETKQSKLEVAAEGEINISTEDLARIDIDLVVRTENSLDYNVIGKEGGALFYKGEKIKLKREKLETLIKNNPLLEELPEDQLAFMFPGSELTPENANDFFEFSPMNLDDLEELVGEEDDEIIV